MVNKTLCSLLDKSKYWQDSVYTTVGLCLHIQTHPHLNLAFSTDSGLSQS